MRGLNGEGARCGADDVEDDDGARVIALTDGEGGGLLRPTADADEDTFARSRTGGEDAGLDGDGDRTPLGTERV